MRNSTLSNLKIKDITLIIAPILFIWGVLWLGGIYVLLSERLYGVTSFNRIFGAATVAGIDAQKRVNVMLIFNLIYPALCLLVAYYIVRWFIVIAVSDEAINQDLESGLSLINSISICGIVSIVIMGTNKLNQYPSNLYAVQALFVMLAFSLFYQRFHFTTYEKFKWCLFAGFAAALFVHFIIWK